MKVNFSIDIIPSQTIKWASLITQLVKNSPAMQETLVRFLGWEDPWRRERLPTPVFLGFPCGSAAKESTCNVWDLGLIPGLGRSPGEGKGYPLQYSGLENSVQSMGSQRVRHNWVTFTLNYQGYAWNNNILRHTDTFWKCIICVPFLVKVTWRMYFNYRRG